MATLNFAENRHKEEKQKHLSNQTHPDRTPTPTATAILDGVGGRICQ